MASARILVVEDEILVAKDLEKLLQSFGYEVVDLATRGEDAEVLALEHRPDLIFMDIRLRGEIDGVVAAQRIRSQLDVPIIFLTALTDAQTLERSKSSEPYAYLIKPFARHEVHAAAETTLHKHALLQQVKQSEVRYRSLFEELPIAVLEEDWSGVKRCVEEWKRQGIGNIEAFVTANPEIALEGCQSARVVKANRSARELFGLRNDSESLQSFGSFVAGCDIEVVRNCISSVANGTLTCSSEVSMRRTDGDEFLAFAQCTVVPGFEQTYERITCCFLDITERKRSMKVLKMQRDFSRSLSAATSVDDLVHECIQPVVSAASMDCVALFLVREGNGLELVAQRGFPDGFSWTEDLLAAAEENVRRPRGGKPWYFDRLNSESGSILSKWEKLGVRSVALVPLIESGRLIACMFTGSLTQSVIPDASRRLVETVAAQVGGTITRIQATESLRKTYQLLKTLHRVQNRFIADHDAQTVYESLLESLLTLTESQIGFIADVYEPPNGPPYLRSRAISNASWNVESLKFYEDHWYDGVKFDPCSGIFGDALLSDSAVIFNDYLTNPRRKDLPHGHPEIRSFMGLPLQVGGQIQGLIGLANSAAGYDNRLVEFLEPYLTTCAGIIRNSKNANRRRLAEDSWKESEKLLRLITDALPVGISYTDAHGCFQFVNRAFESWFGRSREKACGRSAEEVLGEKIHASLAGPMERALAGDTVIYETLMPLKGAGERFVEVTLVPNWGTDSEVRGYCSLFRDVTEARKAQQDLRVTAARLNALVEAMPDSVLLKDLQGRVLLVNKSVEFCVGMDRNQILGKRLEDLVHPDLGHQIVDSDRQVHDLRETMSYEQKFCRPDGKTSYLHIVNFPILDDQGKFIGLGGVARDITELKKSEDLVLLAERLKTAGALTTGIAHNFNNIFQVILGACQVGLLDLDMGNAAGLESQLNQILESCRHGSEIVKRLQNFSRIRSDLNPSRGEVFDLSTAVSQAVDVTRVWWKKASEGHGKNINVVESFTPNCRVRGSQTSMFEVAVNLIRNAVEALPQGGEITVRTVILDDRVVLEVIDTGVGITGNIQGKIFQPFFTTKGVSSSGLGLASCLGIVTCHGGTISLSSSENKGTTVTVSLPHSQEADQGISPAPVDLQGSIRILVVDDMPAMLTTLRQYLNEFGQMVETAMSGPEALAIFEQVPIDLVICDLAMPGMDGQEVCRNIARLCEQKGRPRPYAVILTGWGGALEDRQRAMESGIDTIMEKPVELTRLLELVQMIIRQKKESR
jgi:two-component system, cell cycle sensor histidine kinase and response regulator CckA